MKKKWVGFTVVFSICLSLLTTPGQSRAAADENVRVTLPDFSVNLNGNIVENEYREYPLLVYHDITYFPMTWYDSRMLGLEAIWSRDSGLNIKQSPVSSSYFAYKSDRRNATTYTADAPASAITINGKTIDNTKEKYPLLSFRDVTYFPLTWRFAHDEFGWDYQWNTTGGLNITSHNPQLQMSSLPAYAGKSDIALYNGNYYFVESTQTTNHVFRAPMQQPSDKEEIYSYKRGDADLQTPLSFQIRENTLWLTYHQGGGLSGHDEVVRIGDDGKAVQLQSGLYGYLDFHNTPYGTLFVRLGLSALEGGNMFVLPFGQATTTRVGDNGVIYGVHVTSGGDVGDASSTTVIGDDVYILSTSGKDANRINKINLKTNKSEIIVDESVSWFRLLDKKIYYVKDKDNFLYSSALDGKNEMKLSDHAVSWFDSIDGNVYYTTKKGANQFELYRADANGNDPLVWLMPVTDVTVLNNRLVCRLSENDDYGLVLLDSSGRLLTKVADSISRVFTSDEGTLLQTSKDSAVKLVR